VGSVPLAISGAQRASFRHLRACMSHHSQRHCQYYDPTLLKFHANTRPLEPEICFRVLPVPFLQQKLKLSPESGFGVVQVHIARCRYRRIPGVKDAPVR